MGCSGLVPVNLPVVLFHFFFLVDCSLCAVEAWFCLLPSRYKCVSFFGLVICRDKGLDCEEVKPCPHVITDSKEHFPCIKLYASELLPFQVRSGVVSPLVCSWGGDERRTETLWTEARAHPSAL